MRTQTFTRAALFAACESVINDRIQGIQKAMEDAQQSANSETKSTAGDKHDTSRAMMQREKANQAKQLVEAKKLREALAALKKVKTTDRISQGSIVETNKGTFFMAVGLGRIAVEGQQVFVISAISPVGKAMLGKTAGETFVVNDNATQITTIY